jgi:hypothetical protein
MKSHFIFLLLLLIVVGDMLTCLAYNLNWTFWNYGFFIKTPIELFFFIYLIGKNKNASFFYFIIVLLFFWLLASISTYLYTDGFIEFKEGVKCILDMKDGNKMYLESFIVFNRYIFFFLVISILFRYKDDAIFIKKCRGLFESFFIINGFFIILGCFFSLDIFASYHFKDSESETFRFGYKGLLYGINEVTGVYLLGIAYVYNELFARKRKVWLLLIIIVSSIFLTGAKGGIIGLVILTFYFMARYRFKIFCFTLIPIAFVLLIYISQINFVEDLRNLLNVGLNDDVSKTDFGLAITLLMSGRNLFIYHNWFYMISHWSISNYFFGNGLLYSETDFFDLFYFFGFGSLLYLYYYSKVFFKFDLSPDSKYVFFILMFIAFTGGHIIRSGVVPVFLCLYLISNRIYLLDRD